MNDESLTTIVTVTMKTLTLHHCTNTHTTIIFMLIIVIYNDIYVYIYII